MVKTKRKVHYGLLVLLTVLLGLGLQAGMEYVEYRRGASRAEQVLSAQAEELRAVTGAELQDREELRQEELLRLGTVPTERALAFSAQDRSLLVLVNRDNPLPEDWEAPELDLVASLDGRDYYLDRRCAKAFLDMMADCEAAGCQPYVCSAFRTQLDQQRLHEEKIRKLVLEGLSWTEAKEQAPLSVALPGCSEHQLGLAVDIIDRDYPKLDEGQENTPTQKWLMENCWRYGFILRYPNGTTALTGVIYEPWHYRYVGRGFAEEITRMGVTLEEYLVLREGR
jgi:D-alanyl-D-alanine carboxypeptidase